MFGTSHRLPPWLPLRRRLRLPSRLPPPTGLAVAAIGLALLAACGTAPSSPATSTGGPSAPAAGTTVNVNLSEFTITVPPQNFTPGVYTFVAHNVGHTLHALEISGPGVAGEQTGGLQPGQSGRLTVTLQGGSYELICPIDDHKGSGMDTHITVTGTAPGGGASQPAVPPATSPTGGSGGGNGY